MEYDIEKILYTFEDDYNPDSRPMAQEPRNMYASGQLVSPSVDGSRPGYQGEEFSLEKNLSKVPPKIRDQFIKVNNYLKKIIPKLNAGEKYYTKEQVSSMVEKKFNIKPKYKTIASSEKGFPSDKRLYTKKVNQFEPKSYPVMNNLDSVETKIENTLKNMLIEDKPLNNFWYKALQERTGLNERTIYGRIDDSPTYKVIKNQGAISLKDRFNKPDSHSFLKDFSFSKQLTQALEMEKGMPRFTGMGREKYFTFSPKFKVFEFAKRNFHENRGKGDVKFYNKNGKPITWNYGLELPYKEVYFTYNGKKYSASDKIKNTNNLTNIEILKKDFNEVYKTQTAINNLRIQKIDNPFGKGKISLEDLVNKIQTETYTWGKGTSTFDILHGKKGVKGEPFSNLNFNTRDVNQLEMGINQSKTLTQRQKNNLIKSINTLAGSSNPDAIIERQINLAKDIKSGKITSYNDMKDLLIELCPNKKASGGRVGFKSAGSVLGSGANCGRNHMNNLLKNGTGTTEERNLIRQIMKTGFDIAKGTGKLAVNLLNPKEFLKLKNFVGAPAMAFMAGVEGLDVADRYIRQGIPIKEALGEKWTKFLMPKSLQEYQVEGMKEANALSSPASKRYAKGIELSNDLSRAYDQLEMLETGEAGKLRKTGDVERIADLKKLIRTKEKKYYDYLYQTDEKGNVLGDGELDFKKDYNEYRALTKRKRDFTDLDLFGGMNDMGTDEMSGLKIKKDYFPMYKIGTDKIPSEQELAFDATLAKKPFVRERLVPFPTYKTMDEKPLSKGMIDFFTEYERDKGTIGANQNLDDVQYMNERFIEGPDGVSRKQKIKGLSPLEEYELQNKFGQALSQPGMKGTQFSEGGITGLRSKYEYKK